MIEAWREGRTKNETIGSGAMEAPVLTCSRAG
jgi:hypothetical protein